MLALIRIMAATPYNSWAGSPQFGLRDFFERASLRPELPKEAMAAINLALRDLGLQKYSVESIVSDAPAGAGSGSYSIKLAPADANEPSISLKL